MLLAVWRAVLTQALAAVPNPPWCNGTAYPVEDAQWGGQSRVPSAHIYRFCRRRIIALARHTRMHTNTRVRVRRCCRGRIIELAPSLLVSSTESSACAHVRIAPFPGLDGPFGSFVPFRLGAQSGPVRIATNLPRPCLLPGRTYSRHEAATELFADEGALGFLVDAISDSDGDVVRATESINSAFKMVRSPVPTRWHWPTTGPRDAWPRALLVGLRRVLCPNSGHRVIPPAATRRPGWLAPRCVGRVGRRGSPLIVHDAARLNPPLPPRSCLRWLGLCGLPAADLPLLRALA